MTRNTDDAQIRELVEHWAEAVRRKDLNGAVARHADNMVMFDVPMPLQSQGIEEVQKDVAVVLCQQPRRPGIVRPDGVVHHRRRNGRVLSRLGEGL